MRFLIMFGAAASVIASVGTSDIKDVIELKCHGVSSKVHAKWQANAYHAMKPLDPNKGGW